MRSGAVSVIEMNLAIHSLMALYTRFENMGYGTGQMVRVFEGYPSPIDILDWIDELREPPQLQFGE